LQKFAMLKRCFAMFKFTKSLKVTWSEIEEMLLVYENCLSHGTAHLKAVANALRDGGNARNRIGFSEVFFRCRDHDDVVARFTPFTHDSALRESYSALISAFFDKRGFRATREILPIIRENSSSARWVDGQTQQSRLQVRVLTLLVPLFTLVFVFLRWENFCQNASSSQGVFVLCGSVALFLSGSFLARKVANKSALKFGSSDLSAPEGRERLLRKIGLLHGHDQHILRNLSGALAAQGNPRAIRMSRLIRFALIEEASEEGIASSSFVPVNDWLRSGLIRQREKKRAHWLLTNQRRIWAEMKVNQAQVAAKTNLQLIVLMGIFYLPAFFLILWISGTVVSFDNG
jgi:hypothetical protein